MHSGVLARGRTNSARSRVLIAVVATLVATVSPAAGPAFAAAPAVSYTAEQAVSQPQSNGGSDSVSCWAPRRCMVVGTYLDSAGQLRLTSSRQTNDDWRVYEVPTPPAKRGVHLRSVSCTSSTFCMAVGVGEQSRVDHFVFAERWDGRDWTLTAFPPPPTSSSSQTVSSVSCVSSRFCIAVGQYKSYAEFWDGSGWTPDTTIAPSGPSSVSVVPTAISCVSARFCVAVGRGSGDDGFAATRWDGHTWTVIFTGGDGTADAVSCTSASFCLALVTNRLTNTQVYDGTSWTDAASSPVAVPSAVTCTAPDRCLMVGAGATEPSPAQTSPPRRSQSAVWDGSTWAAVPVPAPSGKADFVTAVSCAGSFVACTAVGAVGVRRDGPIYRRYADEWDGTSWRPTTLSGRLGASWGQLNSVSCPSSTTCLAVGRRDIPDTESGLAQRWDGTAWTRTPIAAVGADPRVDLRSVSCATPTFCIAVGVVVKTVSGSVENQPLAEVWDGTSWTMSDLRPATQGKQGSLSGVSCPTSTDCVAVGAEPGGPMIVRFDGSGWTQLGNRPVAGTNLVGVSCPQPGYCVAAGARYDAATKTPQLVGAVWDGTAWTFTDLPVGVRSYTTVTATTVACATTTSCVLAGYYKDSDGDFNYRGPLSARWNGTAWSDAPGSSSFLVASLTCPAVDDCVGTSGDGGLVEFDGVNWTKTPLPDDDDVPSAISCATTTSCQVVGHVDTYLDATIASFSFPFPFAVGVSR